MQDKETPNHLQSRHSLFLPFGYLGPESDDSPAASEETHLGSSSLKAPANDGTMLVDQDLVGPTMSPHQLLAPAGNISPDIHQERTSTNLVTACQSSTAPSSTIGSTRMQMTAPPGSPTASQLIAPLTPLTSSRNSPVPLDHAPMSPDPAEVSSDSDMLESTPDSNTSDNQSESSQ